MNGIYKFVIGMVMCFLLGPLPLLAQQKATPPGTVKIIADPRTNSVIVYAPKKQAQEAKSVIEKLDKGAKEIEDQNIHIYYLKYADANEMAELLRKIFAK